MNSNEKKFYPKKSLTFFMIFGGTLFIIIFIYSTFADDIVFTIIFSACTLPIAVMFFVKSWTIHKEELIVSKFGFMIHNPVSEIRSGWENVERIALIETTDGQNTINQMSIILRHKVEFKNKIISFRTNQINIDSYYDRSPLNQWDLFQAIREFAPDVARRTQEFDARQNLD